MKTDLASSKIAIVGLGYVGLPLAIELASKYQVIGFDTNSRRIKELRDGIEVTKEIEETVLQTSNCLFSDSIDDLSSCNIYIVTVPTPINSDKKPDMTPLKQASLSIGTVLSESDIVIYESTVYPGATEDVCVPELELASGLVFNKDFYVGYSPERINPGDKSRPLTSIKKVTSGSTPTVAALVDELYASIIVAGTHKATSIKVAEASKLIENVQRDVNIGLVNELHQIFEKLEINTKEVIQAASTKWNFMELYPGLVGGHCISVDPYYLLAKAEKIGYMPDLIRSAREVNESMADFFAKDFVIELFKRKLVSNSKVLVLGLAFKENCPDIRNTKVISVVKSLQSMGLDVDVFDPIVDKNEVKTNLGIDLISKLKIEDYDALFLAVGHTEIIHALKSNKHQYIYDFKGLMNDI